MDKNCSQLFAENTANAQYEDLPREVVDRAKTRLADSVDTLSAGAKGVGIEEVANMFMAQGGHEQATIVNYGGRVPARCAAMANSMQIRSFDSEPVDSEGFVSRWPAHITSTTLPTALALAEWKHLSGKDFLLALLLGEDMVSRILEATRFDHMACFDGNGTANCVGAAAISAKAFGFDAERTLATFGLALNMAGGSMANTQRCWTFKMGNALSSYHAIFAAEIAETGFKALQDPLTGARAYFDMFAPRGDRSDLTRDLGKRYLSDMVIKPWSCCRGNHVVIEAAKEALQGRMLKADEIERIRFGASSSNSNADFPFGNTAETDGLFSRRFTLPTFILTGKVDPTSYDPAWMTNPELGDLLDKLEFYEWNPLTDAVGSSAFAARVDIHLASGEVLHGEVKGDVLGDMERKPLPKEMFEAKFESCAKFGGKVSMEKLRQAYDLAWPVEDVEDMTSFVRLLVP